MKKILCLLLVCSLLLSLCACVKSNKATTVSDTVDTQSNTSSDSNVSTNSVSNAEEKEQQTVDSNTSDPSTSSSSDASMTPATESEEDAVDDPEWDALESFGQVETENGILYVKITLPADFVGDEVTQESIDSKAGETYTSGTLNEDGSVTYKMTKKQHKAMLTSLAETCEESFQEWVDSSDYAISEISHNSDFTSFDVHLETEEAGFSEKFLALAFYMYGGIYARFSGKKVDNIEVNYYSVNGDLIETANSANMGS